MPSMRSLRIGPRLTVCFSVMTGLLLVTAALGVIGIRRVNAIATELATNWLPSVQVLGEIDEAANTVRRTELRLVLEREPERKAVQIKAHEAAVGALQAEFRRYEPLISSVEEKAMYATIQSTWSAYLNASKAVLDRAGSDDSQLEESRKLVTDVTGPKFLDVIKALDADIKLNSEGGQRAAVEAQETFEATQIRSIVAGLLAAASAFGLGLVVSRSITEPIGDAVAFARRVRTGDLTAHLPALHHDEPGDLLRAMSEMNAKLREVVASVRDGSESIHVGADEIATGNSDLSLRTEQQAANLEETSSAMEQMNSAAQQTAASAREANQHVEGVSLAASQGASVMDRVVETMNGIAASSKRIGDIIGVIDGIAFQTNILALNAAVEAARAGEQGRGFAVVASEVRSLARRSADAAKEIKSLIVQSTERVDAGAQLVSEAGDTVQKIVEEVHSITHLINGMGSAAIAQTTDIGQVASSVSRLDQTTQQNAALVEQSAAAAESLRNQAETLSASVQFFKV